jgi:hypothetical protein
MLSTQRWLNREQWLHLSIKSVLQFLRPRTRASTRANRVLPHQHQQLTPLLRTHSRTIQLPHPTQPRHLPRPTSNSSASTLSAVVRLPAHRLLRLGRDVDLKLPNLKALALQKEEDEDFWRRERKAEIRRPRKEREASHKVEEPRVTEKKKGTLIIRLRDAEDIVDEPSTRDRRLKQDAGWASWRSA